MSTSPPASLLGAHTSTEGGLHEALYQGKEIGATTVQLFTANQRRWTVTPLAPQQLLLWKKALEETSLQSLMSHGSYLLNLGAPDPEKLAKSRLSFSEELKRCHLLGISFLNFHPGSSLGGNREECLDRIVESLLDMESLAAEGTTRILLETAAGQGSSIGSSFEELAYILQRVEKKIPIGICIDTCHLFAAGYDIRTSSQWETVLQWLQKQIGLHHLYAFHINDSAKRLGTRVDRHCPLGKGEIGIECFAFLMQDPRTKAVPKYLETPGGPALWKEEIALLRSLELVQR